MSSLAKHPPLVLRAAPGESYGPRAGTPTLAIAPGRESISVLVCCGKGQAKRCRQEEARDEFEGEIERLLTAEPPRCILNTVK